MAVPSDRPVNQFGIQAAVAAGLGVNILRAVAIQTSHRAPDGLDCGDFPPITSIEAALVAAVNASPATRRLADLLAAFCAPEDPHLKRRRARLTTSAPLSFGELDRRAEV